MNHSTIPDFLLNDIIKRALEEDLGGAGDLTIGDNAPIMLDRGERSQHPAARARKGAVLFFPRSSAWLGNSRLVSLVFPFPCFG